MGELRTLVCANIAYKLVEKKMSQAELADRIGVKRSAVSNWLTGRGAPDIDTLGLICEALDTDFNYMFGTAAEKETAPTAEAVELSDVDIQLLALPADVKLMVVQLVERLSGETEVPKIELDEVTRKQVVREVRAQEAQSQQESSDAQEQRSH